MTKEDMDQQIKSLSDAIVDLGVGKNHAIYLNALFIALRSGLTVYACCAPGVALAMVHEGSQILLRKALSERAGQQPQSSSIH